MCGLERRVQLQGAAGPPDLHLVLTYACSLQGNGIDDDGARALAEALTTNTTLKELE